MENIKGYSIDYYCASSHNYALRQGFWDVKNSCESHALQIAKLGLICAEAGEAMEAVRIDDKDNLAEECSDIAIRLFDFCEAYEIDLEAAIQSKMRKNESRARMHGKKA